MNDDLVWAEPQSPEEIIEQLVAEHGIERAYVLFSGGQDSACVDHFMATEYPEIYAGRVFACTGIAAPDVRRFVVEDSRKRGRPLNLVWAAKSYYDQVTSHGFPGPGAHHFTMGYLKYAPWRRFILARLDAGEKAALISGVRKKESATRDKRRFYTRSPINTDGRLIFAKPFQYKNGEQTSRYFHENGLAKSPAYGYMDISGECLCGAFAMPWELKGIERSAPDTFGTIRWLEGEVQATIRALESLDCPSEEHRETLRLLRASPKWGRGGGTAAAEAQSVMEDYCGESCQAG